MNYPNILYINSHDTGRYIQPYGYAVPTPNLQALAEHSVLFRQAFCGNPTCSPSRACLVTGQHAHRTGMLGLAHRGFELTHPERHWGHFLRQLGYRTEQAGMQHVAPKDAEAIEKTCGFDRAQPARSASAEQVDQILTEHQRDRADQPLYLELGFFETHRDFPPASLADDSRYNRPPAPFADTSEHRRDFADYCTMARQLDETYGQIFGQLRARGLWDNTLVICTTDHGLAFPQMKCNLTDHGIGVLMMIKGPAGSDFTPGRVVDGLASQIDVFPTLCDVLQMDRPNWLDGVSLMPMVRSEADNVRDQVVAEVNFHAAYEPMRAVRTRHYKYIRRFDERSKPVLPNCDDSITKQACLDANWTNQPRSSEMLFDLYFDPHEANNLVGRTDTAAEVKDVLEDMRRRLDDFMQSTDDPLLSGRLTAPPHAMLNHRDQPSTAKAAPAQMIEPELLA